MNTLLTPPSAPSAPSAVPPAPTAGGPVRPSAAEIDRRIEDACAQACRAIAPAWPLDRAIAVNPHWERIERPLREVAARMAVLGALRVFPPRETARDAWRSGRITAADLDEALARLPEARAAGLDAGRALAALDETPALQRLPLLIDVLDDDPQGRRRLS